MKFPPSITHIHGHLESDPSMNLNYFFFSPLLKAQIFTTKNVVLSKKKQVLY